MPGTRSDGSITIDTRLDNSGFARGSGELRQAVQSLSRQINSTGAQLRDAFKFDFGLPKQAANTFQRALKQVNSEINSMGDIGRKAIEGDEAALAQFETKSNETLSRIEEMRSELDRFGKTQFETPEHAKAAEEYAKAEEKVNNLKSAVSDAEDKLDQMWEKFGQSEEMQGIEQRITQIETLKKMYEEAVAAGNKVKAEAVQDRFTQLKAETDPRAGNIGFDEAIARAKEEMAALQEKFETGPAQKMQAEVDKLTEKLNEAKAKAAEVQAEMDATPATFAGSSTVEYEKDAAALEATIAKLQEMYSIIREAAGTGQTSALDAFMAEWREMPTLSNMIKSSFQSMISTITTGVQTAAAAISTGLHHPVQLLDRALAAAAISAGKAVSRLASVVGSGIKSGLEKIADAAKRAAVNLASMAKHGIVSGIKKLASSILHVGKSTQQSNNSMKKGFMTVLKYGLGIRSLYVLFNKLRNAIKEGFGELAKQNPQLQTSINNFKASLQTLKGSFAAAFAPIAEIVLPLLTSMIYTISDAISAVGQLIAALTGRSSFMRATKTQKVVSDSAGSAADALGDEAAAAKEAQKTLAGFDDVEILSENKSGSGGSGGGSGSGSGIEFEESPIASAFSGLADMLKEAWEKADFTEIGRMIGEKLRDALNSIPWDKIKDTCRRIAKSIATFLNGFLETPGLFDAIGRTLAEALNTKFEFINSFVQNFHWDSLGEAIKDGLLGVFNNLDWDLIYETYAGIGSGIGTAIQSALGNDAVWSGLFTTISYWLSAIVGGVNEFFASVDWGGLGASIGGGLNDGVNAFDWDGLADTLSDLINGAFDLWYEFVTTFDFDKFGSEIGKSISKSVRLINWKKGGSSVGSTINALFRALNGFVRDTDWESLGKAAMDAVAGFLDTLDWATLGNFASNCLQGLCDFLVGALEDITWSDVADGITGAISGFIEGFSWTDTVNAVGRLIKAEFRTLVGVGSTLINLLIWCGGKIINAIKTGIITAITAIGTWINDNIITPIKDGISSLIAAGSEFIEGLKEKGKEILNAILQGILDAILLIGGIPAWVGEHITGPLLEKLGSIIESVRAAGKSIADAFTGGMGEIEYGTDYVANTVVSALQGLSEQYGLTASDALKMAHGFVEIASDDVPSLTGAFSELEGQLEEAGIPADDFYKALNTVLSVDPNNEDANRLKESISEISSNLDIASTNSDSASKTFENFGSSASLFTAIKLGILNKVIEKLGEEGKISQEHAALLQGTLDSYNSAPCEANLHAVETAFNTTGLSVEDFNKTMLDSLDGLSESSKKEAQEACGALETIGVDGIKGLKNGMTSEADGVKDASKTIARDDITGTMEKELDEHSPSKKLMTVGQYAIQGLMNGMSGQKSRLHSLVETMMRETVNKIDSFRHSFQQAGSSLAEQLRSGIEQTHGSIYYTIIEIVVDIQNAVYNVNWWNLGDYIGTGIYNGLAANSGWLASLARNVAVNMFNAAARALQIHSPSRKFAYIGEMITEGLGDGITDTQSNAVSAVSALANEIVDRAESEQPVMTIGAALDPLDGILTAFSDRMINGFQSMINAMDSIVSRSSFSLPAVAQGTVTPYAVRRAVTQENGPDIESVVSALTARSGEGITRDDLTEILTDICRQYLNIEFYVGDEQIARHANSGNLKLNRRFSAVSV